MTPTQIEWLLREGIFPENENLHTPQLVETHISWVILTDNFAYKIKKPLRFNFLDFSSLQLRKTACEEELRLNRRLSDIYLEVVPISFDGERYRIGSGEGNLLDFAVKMKRVDNTRQMDLLLKADRVSEEDISAIAAQLAHFHRNARIVKHPFNPRQMKSDFADLTSVSEILATHIHSNYAGRIAAWIALADRAVDELEPRFRQRIAENFVRDGHGDLHSRNIFLLDKPVIFDCIEFNEHLRINDVLSELAFLAMDLKRFGRKDFKGLLVKKYNEVYPCFENPQDEAIFQYFLLYRASVRLKITGLRLQEIISAPAENTQPVKDEIISLAALCGHYADKLERMLDRGLTRV